MYKTKKLPMKSPVSPKAILLSFALLRLLLLPLVLTSCGFHLRGEGKTQQYWQKDIHLDGRYGGDFAKILSQTLALQNVKIQAESPFWLTIEQDELKEVTRTLNAKGQTREVVLHYQVRFLLRQRNTDQLLLSPRSIQTTRDLTVNDQQIQAKEYEKATLIQGMQQELAHQLIRQLNAVVPE